MDATPRNFKLSDWVREPIFSYTYIPSDRERDLELENNRLQYQLDELHKRNHELVENQAKIEQKARTQQRQYDAKVYAHWKNKAESLTQKIFELENEAKKAEGLQEIVSKLMDRLVDRSRKLIAIKRILDGSSESDSE